MKMWRMNKLRSPAAGDDTVELIHEDEGLGVEYRLRQCCGGSKKRAVLIILIVSLLVAGTLAAWTCFLVRSKFEAYAVKCFIHQILIYVSGAYLLNRAFIPGNIDRHVSFHLLSPRGLHRV